ncbi:MAG: polymer-forming cytoskeletal protein [Patescibacteria group bacterium]
MKKILSVIITIFVSVLIASGVVYAATRNITATLGGASGDTFQLSGVMTVNSLKVGAQGTGGVTFFNGSIVNNTTTAGLDNPVTFGDNVRIDGRIYRGAIAGTSDTLPVIINDNLEVAGAISASSLTVNGVSVGTKKTYEGTIDLTSSGDEIVSIDTGNTCSPDTNTKYYKYHYKKIAIPEISVSNLPNLRAYCHAHADSGMATMLPNSRDVWVGCSLYYAEGYGYLLYKYESETCAGSVSSTYYYLDGQYKIIIY